VKINGKQRYLWLAVDQDGDVVDVFLQVSRDGGAALIALIILASYRSRLFKRGG